MKRLHTQLTHFIISLSICLMIPFALTLKAQQKASLNVGDPAPPMQIKKWLLGQPIQYLEKGKVYIFEFSGVNCAPCRASIPHLSQLSDQYKGKIQLISVYVYENGLNPKDTVNWTYLERVERFIHNMKSQISYAVALDDPAQFMRNHWMGAANLVSIPNAFVIDQQGILVWIGNPMDLDKIIPKVLEGQLNAKQGNEIMLQNMSYVQKLEHFLINEQYQPAIQLIDSMIVKHPDNKYLYQTRFYLLLQINSQQAYTYGRRLLIQECKDSEPVLFYMSKDILNASKRQQPAWQLAIEFAKRAIKLSKTEAITAAIWNHLAKVYAKQDKFKLALQASEKAISYLKRDDPKLESSTATAFLEDQAAYQDRLK